MRLGGRGHRSAARSLSTSLASGPCRGWARRGRGGGIGALRGQGANERRPGCGGGIPRARHHVDAGPRAPHRAGAGCRTWGNLQAGAFDTVRHSKMLSLAEAGASTDMQQARIDLIAADLAFVTIRGSDAPSLLLKAAKSARANRRPTFAERGYLQAFGRDVGRSSWPSAVACWRWRGPPGPHRRRGTQRAPPTFSWKVWQRTSTGDMRPDCRYCGGRWDVFGIAMSVDEQLRCHWVAGVVARHTSGMIDRWAPAFRPATSSLPAPSVR